jgi:hypothetical protein
MKTPLRIFLGVLLGAGLVLVIGQNCGKTPFVPADSASIASNSGTNTALGLVPGKSNTVIFSSKKVNLNNKATLKTQIAEIKKTGGKIIQVLPNGHFQVEYPTAAAAEQVVSTLSSTINTVIQEDLPKQDTSPKTVFDPKKIKLMDPKLTNPDLSAKKVDHVELDNTGNLRVAVSQLILDDTCSSNKCDNSQSSLFPSIGDQDIFGSCVSWSVGYYINSFEHAVNESKYNVSNEQTLLKTHPDSPYFCSPGFLFPFLNNGLNNGTWPYLAMDLMIKKGCPSMKDLPYSQLYTYPETSSGGLNKKYFPPVDLQVKAMDNRIENYEVMSLYDGNVVQNIKNSILNGHVISLAVLVYNNFFYYGQSNFNYPCPNNPSHLQYPNGVYAEMIGCDGQKGSLAGGHAITIVGFDDTKTYNVNGVNKTGAFKVANQWGENWGDNGYIWIAYDLIPGSAGFAYLDLEVVKAYQTPPAKKAYVVMQSQIVSPQSNNSYNLDNSVKLNNTKYSMYINRQFPSYDGIVSTFLNDFNIVYDVSSVFNLNQDTTLNFAAGANILLKSAELYSYYNGSKFIEDLPQGTTVHPIDPVTNTAVIKFDAAKSNFKEALPLITTQPSVKVSGTNIKAAIFNVVSSGPGPFKYQWYKDNVALSDSDGITGAQASTLNFSSLKDADLGIYYVEVSNYSGLVKSQTVELKSASVCTGDYTFIGQSCVDKGAICKLTITNSESSKDPLAGSSNGSSVYAQVDVANLKTATYVCPSISDTPQNLSITSLGTIPLTMSANDLTCTINYTDLFGKTGSCKSNTVTAYSCTGTSPTGSKLCTDDNLDLFANTASSIVDECTDAKKCEYTCGSDYHLDPSSNSCKLNTATCSIVVNDSKTSETPASGSSASTLLFGHIQLGYMNDPSYTCSNFTNARTLQTSDTLIEGLVMGAAGFNCKISYKDLFGVPGSCISNKLNLYSCSGTVPTNATLCKDDQFGLSANTSNSAVGTCTDSQKCEYACNANYEFDGASKTCKLKASSCSIMITDSKSATTPLVGSSANTALFAKVELKSTVSPSYICTNMTKAVALTDSQTWIENLTMPAKAFSCKITYKNLAGAAGSCTSNSLALYTCKGTVPSNADVCSGDNLNLTANGTVSLKTECTDATKCEYTCKTNYLYDAVSKSCKLIAPVCNIVLSGTEGSSTPLVGTSLSTPLFAKVELKNLTAPTYICTNVTTAKPLDIANPAITGLLMAKSAYTCKISYKDLSGAAGSCTSNKVAVYACQGTPPSYAVPCDKDNIGLTIGTTKNVLVPTCTESVKCEYTCKTGYSYNVGTKKCVKI